jgi:hypothetical protein
LTLDDFVRVCQERKVRKKKKGLHMTLEQAREHQRKHGFDTSHITPAVAPADAQSEQRKKHQLRNAAEMNKTECEYAFMLEMDRCRGEIERWDFAAMTLNWGGMRYTPDFAVWTQDIEGHEQLKFVEVKGAFLGHGDALVKFKAARAHWPQIEFEMWQKAKGGQWNRLA